MGLPGIVRAKLELIVSECGLLTSFILSIPGTYHHRSHKDIFQTRIEKCFIAPFVCFILSFKVSLLICLSKEVSTTIYFGDLFNFLLDQKDFRSILTL